MDLILLMFIYAIYGNIIRNKNKKPYVFVSVFIPCLLPISAIFLLPLLMNHEVNDFSYKIEYHIRINEFRNDIAREKTQNPNMQTIHWRPMSGTWFSVIVYSETELPTGNVIYENERGQMVKLKNDFYIFYSDLF